MLNFQDPFKKHLPSELYDYLRQYSLEMGPTYFANGRDNSVKECLIELSVKCERYGDQESVIINFDISYHKKGEMLYRYCYANKIWRGLFISSLKEGIIFEGAIDLLKNQKFYSDFQIHKHSQLKWKGNIQAFSTLSDEAKNNYGYSREECADETLAMINGTYEMLKEFVALFKPKISLTYTRK